MRHGQQRPQSSRDSVAPRLPQVSGRSCWDYLSVWACVALAYVIPRGVSVNPGLRDIPATIHVGPRPGSPRSLR